MFVASAVIALIAARYSGEPSILARSLTVPFLNCIAAVLLQGERAEHSRHGIETHAYAIVRSIPTPRHASAVLSPLIEEDDEGDPLTWSTSLSRGLALRTLSTSTNEF
jgi:hypothetical protein